MKFWSENMYRRDCLGDRSIDVRIKVKKGKIIPLQAQSGLEGV
jgi:hypothetical protein